MKDNEDCSDSFDDMDVSEVTTLPFAEYVINSGYL